MTASHRGKKKHQSYRNVLKWELVKEAWDRNLKSNYKCCQGIQGP